MIQINLLPDVKLEYIKSQRNKRLVILSALGISAACLLVMSLLAVSVYGLQRKHMSDLDKDIKKYTAEIKKTEDLDRILTVQNQLNNLTSLHDQKPHIGRVLGYIKDTTPAQVSIAQFDVDFATSIMTITGSSNSISTVNKYVDTLKFTEYRAGDGVTGKAFKNVVLKSFGFDVKGTSYTIEATFENVLFDQRSEVELKIPNTITTRSEIAKPEALFQELSNQEQNR